MCNPKVSSPPQLYPIDRNTIMTPKQKSKPLIQRAVRKEGATKKSAANIRNDFLYKLGIPRNSTAGSEQSVTIHPIIKLNRDGEYMEPLHTGEDTVRGSPVSVAHISDEYEQLSLDSNSSFNSNAVPEWKNKNCPKKRGVTFNSQVKIVPIAMRDDYTDRIRARTWNNAEVILENAHRNVMEFSSEGWSWRQCVEEHQMYTCSITGERIHPVHCMHMPVGTYH